MLLMSSCFYGPICVCDVLIELMTETDLTVTGGILIDDCCQKGVTAVALLLAEAVPFE